MNHREANITDLVKIKELLYQNNLPANDIKEHIENFIVIEKDNTIIGVGGLENYDKVGLVRSIVVKPEYRNNGIANNIYKLIEGKASELDINKLYLLTETATEYFMRLGFNIQNRSDIPDSIKFTKQFKELCPSSAIVMCRNLSD